jgi:hypothetical protein
MFSNPATELFNADGRRVVWSQEEYDAAIEAGYSTEPVTAPSEPAPATKRANNRKKE